MFLLPALTICLLVCSTTGTPLSDHPIYKQQKNENMEDPNQPPKGYITTPGIGKHNVHTTPKPWNEARVTCLNEGAHLAVLKTKAEENIIIERMLLNNIEDLWIGIHDQYETDSWITVQDVRLDALGYVHWNENQPISSVNRSKHCVALDRNGWNVNYCQSARPFVCKIPE